MGKFVWFGLFLVTLSLAYWLFQSPAETSASPEEEAVPVEEVDDILLDEVEPIPDVPELPPETTLKKGGPLGDGIPEDDLDDGFDRQPRPQPSGVGRPNLKGEPIPHMIDEAAPFDGDLPPPPPPDLPPGLMPQGGFPPPSDLPPEDYELPPEAFEGSGAYGDYPPPPPEGSLQDYEYIDEGYDTGEGYE